MSRQRYSEDSVIASIGQIQEMLQDETADRQVTKIARVPRPLVVAESLIGGVPSAAEIAESRAARWGEEAPAVRVPATRRSRLPYWILGGVVFMGLVGWGGAFMGEQLRQLRAPLEFQMVAFDQAFTAAQLQVRLGDVESQMHALEGKLAAQNAARVEAEEGLAKMQRAEVARVAEKATKEAKGKPKRRIRRRPSRSRIRRRKPRPRRPRAMTREDKRLDSLIDGL